MSTRVDRINATIDRVGQTLSFTMLNGAPGTFSVVAIVQPLDFGTQRTFLDDVEAMGVNKPGVKLTCKGDATVIADDAFTLDGRNFVVWEVFKHYLVGEVVVVTVIAS